MWDNSHRQTDSHVRGLCPCATLPCVDADGNANLACVRIYKQASTSKISLQCLFLGNQRPRRDTTTPPPPPPRQQSTCDPSSHHNVRSNRDSDINEGASGGGGGDVGGGGSGVRVRCEGNTFLPRDACLLRGKYGRGEGEGQDRRRSAGETWMSAPGASRKGSTQTNAASRTQNLFVMFV